MKRRRVKINQLLLFYVLSLGLIGLSWKYGLIELTFEDPLELHETLDFDQNAEVKCDTSGQLTEISVYNPSLVIHYSTDGGQTFRKADGILKMDDIQLNDLTRIPTSLRWRPPVKKGDVLPSIVVFLENTVTGKRSNLKFITSVAELETDLPIVHLILPESDLFSDLKGLMVMGAGSWYNDDFQEAWWLRDANFTQRGIEWERKVCFQYFEEGELKVDQICGMRISGNATRGFPQKSIRLNAREMYGNDKFKYTFFGDKGQKKYESLVLRMSGNDNTHTMFADRLMQELADGAELLTQKGQAVLVFINGNYWGIYNLRERIDDYFIAKYSDSKKKHVTILEGANAELKDGSKEDQQAFIEMINEIRDKEKIGRKDYDKISGQIDIQSFMDYIFFETYYANNDWPNSNSIWYKTKDQKWKWLLNDLDFSLAYPGNHNLQKNMFDHLQASQGVTGLLWKKLITNETFKNEFYERSNKNMEAYLSLSRIKGKFAKIKSQYQDEIAAHNNRWRTIGSMADWENNCQRNLDFLMERKVYYKEQLSAYK